MGTIDVRRATPNDLDFLSTLQWRWRVEEWSGDPVIDRAGFTRAMRTWAGESTTSHRAFIAAAEGAVVAMGWLGAIERVPTPLQLERRNGQVQSLYVVPEARDRGVGSVLLRRLIDEARLLGFDYLLVHPSERSFPFYRRHGFTGSGEFLEMRLTPENRAAS